MNEAIELIISLSLAVFAGWSWFEARQARVDANKARGKTNTTNRELEEANRLLSIYRESDTPASCKLSKEGKLYTLYMFRKVLSGIPQGPVNGRLFFGDKVTGSESGYKDAKFQVINFFLDQGYRLELNHKPAE